MNDHGRLSRRDIEKKRKKARTERLVAMSMNEVLAWLWIFIGLIFTCGVCGFGMWVVYVLLRFIGAL